jgi:hypothetical protein
MDWPLEWGTTKFIDKDDTVSFVADFFPELRFEITHEKKGLLGSGWKGAKVTFGFSHIPPGGVSTLEYGGRYATWIIKHPGVDAELEREQTETAT